MFFPGMISFIFSNIKNLLIAAVITYAVGATAYGKYQHNKVIEQEQVISEYKIKEEKENNINAAISDNIQKNQSISKTANQKLKESKSKYTIKELS